MKIFVTAKPRAKRTRVEKIDDTHFVVMVKEPAKENRANIAIIEALAEYFNIPLSALRLVNGKKSKHKTFEVR